MNFKSDNVAAANPEIIEAIAAANVGYQPSYGADEYSAKLQEKLSEVFECKVAVYLTSTGTAANSLALAALVEPYHAIFCTQDAHVNTDECGAPELFTAGAHLVPLPSIHGKMQPEDLRAAILRQVGMRPHHQQPGAITLTQATECGTIYTLEEIQELTTLARECGLGVHMDGARFANALVALGCSPAEMTWKAGVDILSFGATKNGAICAEAIVFFNLDLAKNFDLIHKRGAQLISKARFFSCQFLAHLEKDLWLQNAKSANASTQALANTLKTHKIAIQHPTQANEIFCVLPPELAKHLRSQGASFYDWGGLADHYRLVTSWQTKPEDIARFEVALESYFSSL